MKDFLTARELVPSFQTWIGDNSITAHDVYRLTARYGLHPRKGKYAPVFYWDDIYNLLSRIRQEKQEGKFVLNYPKSDKYPEIDYTPAEENMEYCSDECLKNQGVYESVFSGHENVSNITEEFKGLLNEKKKKVIKNDEGKVVPEICPECGSKVGLYIQGEPVYLCSNKKCRKYFGTMPFPKNLKESEEKYIENKYGEKWERQSSNSSIFKSVESKIEKSKKSDIGLLDVVKVDNGSHYIAIIDGGLNGSGKWEDYLKDILKIIKNIPGSYVVDLDVDVLDDVWTLQLGFHKEKLNEGAWGYKPEESDSYWDFSHELGEPIIKILLKKLSKCVKDDKHNDDGIFTWLGLMLDMLKVKAFGESWYYSKKNYDKYKMIRDLFKVANDGFKYLLSDKEENRLGWSDFNKYKKQVKKMYDEFKTLKDYYDMDKDDNSGKRLIREEKLNKNMNRKKKIFLTEEQYQYIKNNMNENRFPVDPNKVLVVKKFLDDNFQKGGIAAIGEDGYPKTISIVALKGTDGSLLKNMDDKQLFYMLQDKFQHLYDDFEKRDKLLKQIIKDWYKDKITKNGILTVNLI